MAQPSLEERIAELLHETEEAHRLAFTQTGGSDPDWPLWYADHMLDRLRALLHADFTRSELVYLLVEAEKERSLRAPGADWARYYGRYLADRYPPR